MDYRFFYDPHDLPIRRGIVPFNPFPISEAGRVNKEQDKKLSDKEAVWSIHKERQRDEQEDEDSLSREERSSLKKEVDKQKHIQSLKDRREAIKGIQLLCKEHVVDKSRQSALIDVLNGEIISINYELGGLV